MAEELASVRERSKRMAEADRKLRKELVERRRSAGMAQQDVASFLGVDVEQVIDFERYDSDPLASEVRRYANAVGVVVTHTIDSSATERSLSERQASTAEKALRHSVYFFKRYRWMWLSLVILTHLLLPVVTLGFVGLISWPPPAIALMLYLMLFGYHLTIFVAGRWELRDTSEGLDGVHSGLETRKKKST